MERSKGITPKQALNKAYLKIKPERKKIELFKKQLILLLNSIDIIEREENQKNFIRDFLRETFFKETNEINTKNTIDLVIHLGKSKKDKVGVIIEAKRPSNKTEMISSNNINVKALQELVLYYLRERVTENNLEIKNLIVTNINEWFIFDAIVFEIHFARNKELINLFNDFEQKRLSGRDTAFFYKEIAEKFIEEIKDNLIYTYFNIKDYEKALRNNDKSDDNTLIPLFKLLSPEHLLKLPFANDSNTLDKNFYGELLHIIGLSETKDGSKKLIERNKAGERNPGSLLESAIFQLDDIKDEEKLFNIGLELVITWINRILFLKLLEAQQVNYQRGNADFSFLNSNKINGFDELNNLFFKVLAVKVNERHVLVKEKFRNVPYLNSSLFEKSEIENKYFPISQISDEKIPIYSTTVLKDNIGKKITGELKTLEYLFKFLDAYDFSSEGLEEIQEENKTLINASVLGLIFEKINGYKDGSFFTPGSITMYMSRETIRRAVILNFNEIKKWNVDDITGLYNNIEDTNEANNIINSMKICDPAVGSGHFLVSALNELISLKSELHILTDKTGKRLKEYNITVENDELIVTDEEGSIFSYNPNNKESQRIQETLFNEKRIIIENCLFGVDINPNSVKICRLRLWIELLKNTFYTKESDFRELETLPNIDINIKCGNSLISRFDIDVDIKTELKKLKYSVQQYKDAVTNYKNASGKDAKLKMEYLINDIKTNFQTEVEHNDKRVRKISKLLNELEGMEQGELFNPSKSEISEKENRKKIVRDEINKLTKEIEKIRNNRIYENAFEWRFEFPEVLNDDGDFIGFDLVIGNPPYIGQSSHKEIFREVLATDFGKNYHQRRMDYFYFFFHKAILISKINTGIISFITTNYFLNATYADKLRKHVYENCRFIKLLNFNEAKLFENATGQHNVISLMIKNTNYHSFVDTFLSNNKYLLSNSQIKSILDGEDTGTNYYQFNTDRIFEGDKLYFRIEGCINNKTGKINNSDSILFKIINNNPVLNDVVDICQGIVTGANILKEKQQKDFSIDANEGSGIFVLSEKEINNLSLNKLEKTFIKPWFKNSDIQQWFCNEIPEKYIIYFTSMDIHTDDEIKNLINHFKKFKPLLINRNVRTGTFTVEQYEKFVKSQIDIPYVMVKSAFKKNRYFCVSYARDKYIFESPKIVCPQRSPLNTFGFTESSWYAASDVYYIIEKENSKVNLKYILSLLNSKLYYYWLYNKGQRKGEILQLFKDPLSEIPIKLISSDMQKIFIRTADHILKLTQSNDYLENPRKQTKVKEYQIEIDKMVYELYDINKTEIDIIEAE